MSAAPISQHWTAGKGGAPKGTREWADYVRLQMVSMADHLGENEESFLGYMEMCREERAWTLMTKHDGSTFKTVEEFCSYKRPWGLGTSWTKLRPFLVAGMAKRGKPADEIERVLQIESVPEAAAPKAGPGRGHKKTKTEQSAPEETTRRDGGAFSERDTQRLRAVTRAPDAVKDAYREGRISQTLAAKLGPKDPKPELAAKVAEIAGEIRTIKDRKQVDRLVRDRLGEKEPSPVERILKLVRKLSKSELHEFEAQFDEFLKGQKA